MKTLDELEAVDWKLLKHAYGDASDVPQLIRDLASKRPKIRDAAFEKLYSNLWHQGSVYSATPSAVPFLIGLLQYSDLPDPAGVLAYLSALATGSSYLDVHQSCGLPYFDEKRTSAQFQEELQAELTWANNTRLNVADGLPFYVPFMDANELKTQTNAFFLIGELVGDAGRQLLVERVMADDSLHTDVLATAIFSLRRNESCPSDLIEQFRVHESPIVKYGVSMLCAQFAPQLATSELLNNLTDFLTDYYLAFEKYEHLPFSWDFPYARYAGQVMVDLKSSTNSGAIDYLTSKLPDSECDSYADALRTLLTMTFSEKIDPTNLTAQQTAALTAIGNHELTWDTDGVCRYDSFAEFRIPASQKDFVKLFGSFELPK